MEKAIIHGKCVKDNTGFGYTYIEIYEMLTSSVTNDIFEDLLDSGDIEEVIELGDLEEREFFVLVKAEYDSSFDGEHTEYFVNYDIQEIDSADVVKEFLKI